MSSRPISYRQTSANKPAAVGSWPCGLEDLMARLGGNYRKCKTVFRHRTKEKPHLRLLSHGRCCLWRKDVKKLPHMNSFDWKCRHSELSLEGAESDFCRLASEWWQHYWCSFVSDCLWSAAAPPPSPTPNPPLCRQPPSRLPVLTAARRYGRISFALTSGWMVFVIGALVLFFFLLAHLNEFRTAWGAKIRGQTESFLLFFFVLLAAATLWFYARWRQLCLRSSFPSSPFLFFLKNISPFSDFLDFLQCLIHNKLN